MLLRGARRLADPHAHRQLYCCVVLVVSQTPCARAADAHAESLRAFVLTRQDFLGAVDKHFVPAGLPVFSLMKSLTGAKRFDQTILFLEDNVSPGPGTGAAWSDALLRPKPPVPCGKRVSAPIV